MNCKPRDFLFTVAWRFPWIRVLSSYRPLILVYHRIPSHGNNTGLDAKAFEEQIIFLRQHFDITSAKSSRDQRDAFDKIQVLLPLDDGFPNQAEVAAPILRKYHVPALFFVSSRHSTPGKYLWFSYLKALEQHFHLNGFYFEGEFVDMSPDKRRINLHRLRETLLSLEPHPAAMYEVIDNKLPRLEDFVGTNELADHFAGMTVEQVGELASDPLFSVGIHTVDHPFLTKCDSEEVYRQILNNKAWLEGISNQPCTAIAYPAGQYSADVLRHCQQLGVTEGHALIPLLGTHPEQELPRVGIYSGSLEYLGFKVQ